MREDIRSQTIPSGTEQSESPELFRASLGFDFIFSTDEEGKRHCYCIEINGHDAGVVGVQEIPKGDIDSMRKTIARIRAAEDPVMAKKFRVHNEIIADIVSGDFNASPEAEPKIREYMEKSASSAPLFKHAYRNPSFIESIANDKWLQEKYIPNEYLPRIWHEGESPVSSTGLWVVKRRDSVGSQNVFVLSNKGFEEQFLHDVHLIADFVAQEFIRSDWTHAAHGYDIAYPASMRLLMDFRYTRNGAIETDYAEAYQRIGQYPLEGIDTENVSRTDRLVVSKHTGATSAAASPEEIQMAKEAAEAIIRNLADGYKKNLDLKGAE